MTSRVIQYRIPEVILVRVREQQLPTLAAIIGFVDARQITWTGAHHDGDTFIDSAYAAKIEVLSSSRLRASLLIGFAIFCAKNTPAVAGSPRDTPVDRVDSAQARSCT
ncbi:MAG: hypothetical protein JO108_11080 [Acidobacteriaceae bacterium]|nr:hypothetical protein [Acidobacteriaceae bacterium]